MVKVNIQREKASLPTPFVLHIQKNNTVKIQVFQYDDLYSEQLRREKIMVAWGKMLHGQQAEDNSIKEIEANKKETERKQKDSG